jgi:hypothetical protein
LGLNDKYSSGNNGKYDIIKELNNKKRINAKKEYDKSPVSFKHHLNIEK